MYSSENLYSKIANCVCLCVVYILIPNNKTDT